MPRNLHPFALALLVPVLVAFALTAGPTAHAEEETSLEPAFEVSMDLEATSKSAKKASREALEVSPGAPPGAQSPQLIEGSAPFYPESARKARIQGSTTVGGTIDREGVVRNVVALEPVPEGLGSLFDEAARGALSRWRFEPGTLDGEPVPVAVEVKVHFRLLSRHRPAKQPTK